MNSRPKNDTLVVYVHGKGGSPSEAEHYRPLFPDCDVVGLDYQAETPWDARAEFPLMLFPLTAQYRRIILIANSIGAYFSMCALSQIAFDRAYFISPIVDMERLICDMMRWAGVTEPELRERGTIATAFGETLSWDYLCYVRQHPPRWQVPTRILYGGRDHLSPREVITAFADALHVPLCVMETGEHWFHTPEQMAFLDSCFTRWQQEDTVLGGNR